MKVDTSHRHNGKMHDLGEVTHYLNQNGLRIQGSRVDFYRRILDRFAENAQLSNEEAWALAELRELRVIVHAAKANQVIADGLSRCLKGAHILQDETVENSGNAGRNNSFELYIASKMTILGSNVSIPAFGTRADVEFSFQGKMIPVECKRLYSLDKADAVMQGGCSQVSKRVAAGEFGVAAISLTRALWAGVSMEIAGSLEEARMATEKLYAQWTHDMLNLLNRYPRVALIYIHVQIPFVGENDSYSVYEREFLRTRTAYETLPEAPVVDEFERLMTRVGIENAIAARIASGQL